MLKRIHNRIKQGNDIKEVWIKKKNGVIIRLYPPQKRHKKSED